LLLIVKVRFLSLVELYLVFSVCSGLLTAKNNAANGVD